jgi:hypothetical protein
MPTKTANNASSNVRVNRSKEGLQITIAGPLAEQFDETALQSCLSTFASCAATSDCVGILTRALGGFCGQGTGTQGSNACETASTQLLSALCGYRGK